jgi:hypothetical protein
MNKKQKGLMIAHQTLFADWTGLEPLLRLLLTCFIKC